jgi:hypothetical protein
MSTTARVSPLTELVCQIIDASKAFWQRRAAIDELASLNPSEVACIGRDLGISAAELRVLASRNKEAADLLIRRMEALRLEPRRVDPLVMRDLQRCCSNCDSKQLCAHELEDKPKDATWPKYCPNEQTIEALMDQAASTRRMSSNTVCGTPLKIAPIARRSSSKQI